MSKKKKLTLSTNEVIVAAILRQDPERWFTPNDISDVLDNRINGTTAANYLNRFDHLGAVDVLRTQPFISYRWNPSVVTRNPTFVARLDRALVELDLILPVVPDEPEPVDPRGSMNEGLGPVDDEPEVIIVGASDTDEEALTPTQLRLQRDYEAKLRMVTQHGKNGRFLKHNLVWHPQYGSGVIEKQHGSKQMEVKFHRPHGKLVVMDSELTEDKEAILKVEEMTCVECGKKFPRGRSTGRFPLYCSTACRNRRNARIRAEKVARAAERAALQAAKNVDSLQAPNPQPLPEQPAPQPVVASEPPPAMAALVSDAVQVAVDAGEHGTHIAVVYRLPDQAPEKVRFLSIEEAIDHLMGLLP